MTARTTPDIHTTTGKLADLRNRYKAAKIPSGEAAVYKVARQKQAGRPRANHRLLYEVSFVELDALARHRSANFGLADNRPLGEIYGEKIVKVMDLAIRTGRPLVGINEGGGARIQGVVVSLGLYGEIFHRNVQASV